MMSLPPPFPEEVVGSYLLRLERETALARERLLFLVTGHKLHSHSFVLTQYASIAANCGMSVESFLQCHTLLPYFTAFMSDEERASFWNVSNVDAKPLAGGATIARHVTHGQQWLRLCPRCVIEDRRQYGWSYWKRAHHIAGVRVCHIHLCELVVTVVELKRSVPQLLPHEVLLTQKIPRGGCPYEALLEISKLTANALRSEIESRDWPTHYQTRAIELGYRFGQVGVMGNLLSQDLAAYFGQKFLREHDQEIIPSTKAPWPGRLTRHSNFRTTAFRHVLLNVFLNSKPRPSAPQYNERRPDLMKDYSVIERKALIALDEALEELLKSGKRIAMEQLYRQVGIFSTMKHYKHRVPGLVEWFRRFGLSPAAKKSWINRRKSKKA